MPNYSFVARTSLGSIERGVVQAGSPDEARARLAKAGQKLVGIKSADAKVNATQDLAHSSALARVQLESTVGTIGRLADARGSQLLLDSLAALLGSGLELSQSLRELEKLSTNRRQAAVCLQLAEAVEGGRSFASALADSRLYPPLVSRLVQVGEETGELVTNLRRGADYLRSRRERVGGVVASLAYPSFLAVASLSVAVYLVGWAVPQLAKFLDAMGRKLPWMTQTLLDAAAWVQVYGAFGLVAAIVACVTGVLFVMWPPGRYQLDRLLLKVPMLGSLDQMTETSRLASNLALMLRSGVRLPDALQTANDLHRNRHLAAQLREARQQLIQGSDFARSLSGRPFGRLLASMAAVGERTGDLPRALDHVAELYSEQADRRLSRISKFLEPAMIVFVGGLVGYVYIAFFMALMSAGGNFR